MTEGIPIDVRDISARYFKQMALKEMGEAGQRALGRSKAVIIGSGALGCAQSQILVRAGIGAVRLIDFDVVELNNLHRQILFTEEDAAERRFKTEAAAAALRRMNSACSIEVRTVKAGPENLPSLIEGASIVLDATDNVGTRLNIDRACRQAGIGWIYGGVAGTGGTVVTLPAGSPCLRCHFGEPPPADAPPVWRQSGLFAPAVLTAASLQASLAIRFLTGGGMARELIAFDVWRPGLQKFALTQESQAGCPCAVRSAAPAD